MIINFRDELGIVSVAVDEYGISFAGNEAYFSDGEKDYKVKAEYLISIEKECN